MQKQIAGYWINLTRKRIKNVYLRISKTGEISVNTPNGYPDGEIERLLIAKRAWIAKIGNKREIVIAENAVINVFDRQFTLVRFDKIKGCDGYACVDGDRIVAYCSKSVFVTVIEKLLSQILRENAVKCLDYYKALSGLNYGEVVIKKLRSKWGYCRISDKKIVFSLNLIFKPCDCLEYVAMHELAHTAISAHDKRFYALVSKYKPDYKNSIKLLKS